MGVYYVHDYSSDSFNKDDIGDLYYSIEFMSHIILIIVCVVGITMKWFHKQQDVKKKGMRISGRTILSSLFYAVNYSICIWFRCYGFVRIVRLLHL